MALAQVFNDGAEVQLLVLQQNQQMVNQVGGFVGQLSTVIDGGGEGGFYSFFTHFLCNALGATRIKACGIRAFWICGFTRLE